MIIESIIHIITTLAIDSLFESSLFKVIELFFFYFFFLISILVSHILIKYYKYIFNYYKYNLYSLYTL